MAITYKGFSTVGRTQKFRLTDFELVKQDLINHFNIRKGEKLMNPDFGTVIWSVIHEPLSEDLKSVIISDIKTIVEYDPRIGVDNVVITEYLQGIQIELELRYIPNDLRTVLNLKFDNESKTASSI
jgi:phage baseplate assembly protein W